MSGSYSGGPSAPLAASAKESIDELEVKNVNRLTRFDGLVEIHVVGLPTFREFLFRTKAGWTKKIRVTLVREGGHLGSAVHFEPPPMWRIAGMARGRHALATEFRFDRASSTYEEV